VKATLAVGILAWGTKWSVPKTYGPLCDFMKKSGSIQGREWREWQVYDNVILSSRNGIIGV